MAADRYTPSTNSATFTPDTALAQPDNSTASQILIVEDHASTMLMLVDGVQVGSYRSILATNGAA
jgi:hypothetical protein